MTITKKFILICILFCSVGCSQDSTINSGTITQKEHFSQRLEMRTIIHKGSAQTLVPITYPECWSITIRANDNTNTSAPIKKLCISESDYSRLAVGGHYVVQPSDKVQ